MIYYLFCYSVTVHSSPVLSLTLSRACCLEEKQMLQVLVCTAHRLSLSGKDGMPVSTGVANRGSEEQLWPFSFLACFPGKSSSRLGEAS